MRIHPDYYAGMVAFAIQRWAYEEIGARRVDVEGLSSFGDIFLWTILEGFILTAFLIVLSLLAATIVGRVTHRTRQPGRAGDVS